MNNNTTDAQLRKISRKEMKVDFEGKLSLKERIMSETDAATLKSMLKAASSAVSYADFEEKMKSL